MSSISASIAFFDTDKGSQHPAQPHEFRLWHPSVIPGFRPSAYTGIDYLDRQKQRLRMEDQGVFNSTVSEPTPPITEDTNSSERPFSPLPPDSTFLKAEILADSGSEFLGRDAKSFILMESAVNNNQGHIHPEEIYKIESGAKEPLQYPHSRHLDTMNDIHIPENVSVAIKQTENSSSKLSAQLPYQASIWNVEDAVQGINGTSDHLDTIKPINELESPPAIPALTSPNVSSAHLLPRLEVGSIIEANINDQNWGNVNASESPYTTNNDHKMSADLYDGIVVGGYSNDDDSTKLGAGHQSSPTNKEAKFEEKLPLLSPKAQGHILQYEKQENLSPSSGWPAGDGDDFFGHSLIDAEDDAASSQQISLDRNVAMQALQPLDSMPDSHQDRQLSDAEHHLSQHKPDISIHTNANLPEKRVEKEGFEVALQPKSPTMEYQEEDLAAMWKAALGDDELLDENEPPVDPLFFQENGEGSLSEDLTRDMEESHPHFSHLSAERQSVGDDILHNPSNSNLGFQHHGGDLSNHVGLQINRSTYVFNEKVPYSKSGIPHSFSAPAGFNDQTGQQVYSNTNPATRPSMPESVSSFADKSMGGYTSPYDLPMSVSRPKKKPYLQQMNTLSNVRISSNLPPPPPRNHSTSFVGHHPKTEASPPFADMSRSNSSQSLPNSNLPSSNPASTSHSNNIASSFFEDLPSSKPRPLNNKAGYISPLTQAPQDSHADTTLGPPQHVAALPQSTQNAFGTSHDYQLLPPERMGLFGSNLQENTSNQTPIPKPRYSPAPPQQLNKTPTWNQYVPSSSSSARPPPPSQSMSFQPRTSSPLAQSSSIPRHHQQNSAEDASQGAKHHSVLSGPVSYPSHTSNLPDQHQEGTDVSPAHSLIVGPVAPVTTAPALSSNSPLPSFEQRYALTSRSLSRSPYVPDNFEHDQTLAISDTSRNSLNTSLIQKYPLNTHGPEFGPPRRSHTQSPSTLQSRNGIPSSVQEPYQRPSSASHHLISSNQFSHTTDPSQESSSQHGLLQSYNYITPTDGREHDPLERWKGYPIISFGFGGLAVTSFPKQIPRYASGQVKPMIKCSPGEVRLNSSKALVLDENILTFPGPLKSKSKKKEILDWLQRRLLHLEHFENSTHHGTPLPDYGKRHEEKILLWKLLRILVDYDGVIQGNPAAISDTRHLLLPKLKSDFIDHGASHESNEHQGISKHELSNNIPFSMTSKAMETIRLHLLRGDREKAVWYAVDQRLWAHAMLLSSTLEQAIWKQVCQEFIRQEVKAVGPNTQSLASLYQVFAGNWEESIDELVPPSARAGLQLVSKATGIDSTKNGLAGLDRWQEVLSLVLSNPTPEDGKVFVSLGRMLSSYGRVEAAHICFILARSPGLFGGTNDPQIGAVLLGSDNIQHPSDFDRESDSILLTEIYDFATTVLANSPLPTNLPHLQAYKLFHAMILAEYGYRSEAQQYCDVIASTLKSTTKLAPYYHGLLFGALDDLMERLRQARKDGNASWMSRPSMEKVSGSFFARFNQFISGDEIDAASTVSGKAQDQDGARPFANLAGDSPGISRTPSSNDLYNTTPPIAVLNGSVSFSGSMNSRYAPASQYTPRSSLDQVRGRSSQDLQRPLDGEGLRPSISQNQQQSRNNSATGNFRASPQNPYKPSPQLSAYSPQVQADIPTPPLQADSLPTAVSDDLLLIQSDKTSYEPASRSSNHTQSSDNYNSPPADVNYSSYEPPANTIYESSSYEPPDANTKYPSSYDPNDNNVESSNPERPKKKSFLDDDDDEDFTARAAALLKADKAEKNRTVDETVRKAAEADGIPKISSIIPYYMTNFILQT